MSNPAKFKKTHISRDFNSSATNYDKFSFLQKEIGSRLLERLMYLKISPNYILDIGGGTGSLCADLSTIYPHATIVNLDIAELMLNADKSNALKCCADFDMPPFKDNQFDLIISSCALQWSIDLKQTINQLNRILKDNGILMFSTFGPDTLKELKQSWLCIDSNTHVNEFSDMHLIGDILLQHRFIDPVVDKEDITVTYKNASSLMHDLKNMGASNKNSNQPKGLTSPKTIKAVNEVYEELFLREDGNIPATFEIIYGLCWGKQTQQVHKIHVDTIKNIS